MSQRLRSWMRSDLIGVPTTIAAFGLVAIAIALFFVAGPVAGLAVGLVIVGLGVYLVARLGLDPSEPADVGPPLQESAQRILVVANQGLSNPALVDVLVERASRGPLDARLIVPVSAASRAQTLAGDIDAEVGRGQERLDGALGSLAGAGIEASGHVDRDASPMAALVDGLREFPADEVLLVPGAEHDWEGAEDMAAEIRRESGVEVTEIGR